MNAQVASSRPKGASKGPGNAWGGRPAAKGGVDLAHAQQGAAVRGEDQNGPVPMEVEEPKELEPKLTKKERQEQFRLERQRLAEQKDRLLQGSLQQMKERIEQVEQQNQRYQERIYMLEQEMKAIAASGGELAVALARCKEEMEAAACERAQREQMEREAREREEAERLARENKERLKQAEEQAVRQRLELEAREKEAAEQERRAQEERLKQAEEQAARQRLELEAREKEAAEQERRAQEEISRRQQQEKERRAQEAAKKEQERQERERVAQEAKVLMRAEKATETAQNDSNREKAEQRKREKDEEREEKLGAKEMAAASLTSMSAEPASGVGRVTGWHTGADSKEESAKGKQGVSVSGKNKKKKTRTSAEVRLDAVVCQLPLVVQWCCIKSQFMVGGRLVKPTATETQDWLLALVEGKLCVLNTFTDEEIDQPWFRRVGDMFTRKGNLWCLPMDGAEMDGLSIKLRLPVKEEQEDPDQRDITVPMQIDVESFMVFSSNAGDVGQERFYAGGMQFLKSKEATVATGCND